MSDIGSTTSTPGVRGQTRSTWRDEDHLRGMLLRLKRENSDATRAELMELYLAEAKGPEFHALPRNEAFIDDALRRAFDNDYGRLRPARQRRPRDVSSLVDNIRSIILLDLPMPNGKPLRECTGRECRRFSGWHARIADRVGDDGIVGEVLTEADVVDIRDSSAEGAVQ